MPVGTTPPPQIKGRKKKIERNGRDSHPAAGRQDGPFGRWAVTFIKIPLRY